MECSNFYVFETYPVRATCRWNSYSKGPIAFGEKKMAGSKMFLAPGCPEGYLKIYKYPGISNDFAPHVARVRQHRCTAKSNVFQDVIKPWYFKGQTVENCFRVKQRLTPLVLPIRINQALLAKHFEKCSECSTVLYLYGQSRMHWNEI